MINCIAIDNDKSSLELISKFCQEVSYYQLQKTFENFIEASRYLRSNQVEVIIMETQINDISAFEFLKNSNQQFLVIFITSRQDLAIEAFASNAIDYLLKPINFNRFMQASMKVKELFLYRKSSSKNEDNFLHVRSEYNLIKIAFVDILYIETLDDYIKIHLLGKKPILTLMSMKSVMEKLPEKDFVRVHRSFIVPLNRIESVRGKTINLGITEVPIGKSHEESFYKVYISQGF